MNINEQIPEDSGKMGFECQWRGEDLEFIHLLLIKELQQGFVVIVSYFVCLFFFLRVAEKVRSRSKMRETACRT